MRFKSQASILVLALIMAFPLVECNAASRKSDNYSDLKRFSQVYDAVQKKYVRETTDEELIDGALKGMLQNLDPHSSYLTAKEYKELVETTAGKFFGIGVEISFENGQITIVTPIEDTPAYRAGVKAGDIILAIDGQPTQDMGSQEVVNKIRGAKGTEVELLLISKDSRMPKTVRIERDSIPVISVKARYLEEGYLWIRLTRFSERTTQELRAALTKAEGETALKGIVLDLRNNPGGLLGQAVSVSDLFLKEGIIVSIKGRGEMPANHDYTASNSKTDLTVPVVVLINSGSASAAEIVAGALQDHKRAVLVGERTFGKGSVQEIIPLPNYNSALKLTTALYYTPSGRSIQAEGVMPDLEIPFEMPLEEVSKMPKINVREQDLSKHLENGKKLHNTKNSKFKLEPEVPEFLARDNQLRFGLQLVKSLPKLQELSW